MAKAMNLNIQRFTGEGTDLDFRPEQTEALMNGLSSHFPELVSAVDMLTEGVEKLTQDWGDGNAQKDANNFRSQYLSMVRTVNEYINSVGGWASSVGNAFCEKYSIGARVNFTEQSFRTDIPEFNVVNSTGATGPINDQVGVVFEKTFNTGMSDIQSALRSINNDFTSNPEAFLDDVYNDGYETVSTENEKTKNSIEKTAEQYINYLRPYITSDLELKTQSQNAAKGSIN